VCAVNPERSDTAVSYHEAEVEAAIILLANNAARTWNLPATNGADLRTKERLKTSPGEGP